MAIRFYHVDDAFGCFSNFALYELTIDDKVWPTSEHFFQAQKFSHNSRYQEKIRGARTPHFAADLGRDRNYPIRRDWDTVKDDYMRWVVLEKFAQYPDLGDLLLSTGDERIIEATPKDNYWGVGRDGRGRNMLGVILGEVRRELHMQRDYLGTSNVIPFVPIPERIEGAAHQNPAYLYREHIFRKLKRVA
ncbi:NADAR family protein [Candidatus Woesearchaeota archaeon]|nr:NADAR family protein [Candidatus Woesearchaeota archaeon]